MRRWGEKGYHSPVASPPGIVLINIRPAAGNRGMEIQDEALRGRVRAITRALVGEGEPLP